ncbi:MAG TPA: T9SS type A sorting domain-containing protein [Chitinophagales bacterium]|nr:T9SS type A sorting domain-containing protein [Chitinophagales bacterium]HNJ88490.1 T9SS type A sorting domain-containing protein [Chitinophagales bacterium]HNM07690.1 T9SS type A sorting domain-containing protein [Chitinophagales bacterium]
MRRIFPWVLVCLYPFAMHAQIDTVTLTEDGHFYFENFLPYSAYSSLMNRNGEPYLYAACRELGMVTFDISDPDFPVPVDTIPTTALNNLIPNNISQTGDYLYVATGGFNLIPQKAGLAIMNLADAAHPVITDKWDSVAYNQGAAIAISDGNYAYLGGMDDGLIILDVSNKSNITFKSSILPDPNYPEVPDLFSVPNVRGLALYGADTLMVAYDAGGLRMLDVSNKSAPIEIGKYADPDIENIAQSAYNNIAIKQHYAYIPVDMCGLLVVDIADSDMSTVAWFNPWDCDSTNWNGRPGHTNEVRINEDEDLLFVSGGDSELLIFDISNPATPTLKATYGVPFDSIVAWSLDVFGNQISLALVDNSFVGFPYYSDVGGIQLLQYEAIHTIDIQSLYKEFKVYPNPSTGVIVIDDIPSGSAMRIMNLQGVICEPEINGNVIDCSSLASGIYILQLHDIQGRLIGSSKIVLTGVN